MAIDAGESHLKRVSHWKSYFVILTIVFVLIFIISLSIGGYSIPFYNILVTLAKNIPIIGESVDTSGIVDFGTQEAVIIQLRMPRVISGTIVGIALSAAGVAYQGIFRNPMADSYTVGAMGGATLGAAMAIVLGVGVALFGINTVPIFAFVGALGAVILVYLLAREGQRVPVTTLILVGLTITIMCSAIVTVLQTIAGDTLHALIFWTMGGFNYSTWTEVVTLTPVILIGTVVIYLYGRDLNILVLGEEQAQHLGVEIEKVKKILLITGALMAASAVSIAGLIGFVGLIIPHLTRLITGPDHRVLLPTSAILGASFMMLCDAVARVIILPSEFPVGAITALTGGPFFIYILLSKRRKYAAR